MVLSDLYVIALTYYKDFQHIVLSIFIKAQNLPALCSILYQHSPYGLVLIQDKSSGCFLESIHNSIIEPNAVSFMFIVNQSIYLSHPIAS